MRIIVTGGSGRLGRGVTARLADVGHAVTNIDRCTGPSAPGVEHISTDLLDAAATAALFEEVAPDVVVHLAAVAVPFSRPENEILLTNTSLTWTVLEAAVAAGTGRVLVASSPTPIGYGAPAGWSPAYLPLDERHPLAPWNAYALSKMVMEDATRTFVRAHGDSTLFGIFRPCYVITPEEWAGAPTQQGHTLVDRLADPALAAVSLFNYVDVRDVADFVATWIERAPDVPNGMCFFVGADDALAIEPLASLLPHHIPETEPFARALTGRKPAFTSRLAHDLLGWSPTRSWRTELAHPLREELAARADAARGHSPAKETTA